MPVTSGERNLQSKQDIICHLEIFDDVMVLMWQFSYDMSGRERCEQFDTKSINNSFLSSKSGLNLIGFLHE